MFPTSHARSWWLLWIPCLPSRWNRSLTIFVRFQDGTCHWTTFASPSAWHVFPLTSRALAWMIWPGCKLLSRQSPPGPPISVGRFFFQWSKLCETCPRIRQVSRPIDILIIIDALLLLDIQIRMSSSGYVNVFQWKKEMTLLSASKVWLGVQRDGGIWSFLKWTKSRSSVHRQPETNLEVVEETLLILQESQYYFLLELVDTVPRWMFSSPDLLKGFDSSICDWKTNSPCLGNITSFALSLFE